MKFLIFGHHSSQHNRENLCTLELRFEKKHMRVVLLTAKEEWICFAFIIEGREKRIGMVIPDGLLSR